MSTTLAVLITCHNRRNITLACLEFLYQQNANFDVYLVDDGSSDGTSEAVSYSYPKVNIIQGNGELFWAGGMRLAFSHALKQGYDYYVWLNDDTLLEPNGISHLLSTHRDLAKHGYPDSIVVGSVKDPITGKHTYGGRIRSKRIFSHTFNPVEPGNEPKECDTMQGNIVLIPHGVVEKVGNIDSIFIHTMADIDYGLRARKLGCKIWIASGYLGLCSRNSVRGSWADTNLPIRERLNKAFQVKAFPPKIWAAFLKRHSGQFWFIYWFFPYIRAIIGYKNLDKYSSFRNDTKKDTAI